MYTETALESNTKVITSPVPILAGQQALACPKFSELIPGFLKYGLFELSFSPNTVEGDRDLSQFCLIVGAPGRAEMIGKKFFTDTKRFSNDHRGLVSYTGYYGTHRLSVTTSGMGGASMGIILPEAARSGARLFIRVGSCGSLIKESNPGDPIIVTGAIRYDGASKNWAPPEFPAIADWRVVGALVKAAEKHSGIGYYRGLECTTDCFNAGQGRPGLQGEVFEESKQRDNAVRKLGAVCYSMEAASLFVWCATQGYGMPCGAINTVFANRITNAWDTVGEETAAEIALNALVTLSQDSDVLQDITRLRIPYQV